MNIKPVTDPAFVPYGKIIEEYDLAPLLDTLRASTSKPSDSVVYVPSEPELEKLPVSAVFQNNFYGGMPIQVGYCNGSNKALNCLEYHRDSEINIAADDVVLLLAKQQDITGGKLDTAKVEAFLLPADMAVELYATTLHYAPCGYSFRVIVVLPKYTNTSKPEIEIKNVEDKMLWARNKWLLAHPDSPEAKDGAYIGLTGINITL